MAKVTFIQFSGKQTTIDVHAGATIMKVAIDNLVPGIDADCGGECSCATCHVLVTEDSMDKTGSASDQENSMLDLNPDRQSNSRLSCQLIMSDDLDGLVVNLPEFQY